MGATTTTNFMWRSIGILLLTVGLITPQCTSLPGSQPAVAERQPLVKRTIYVDSMFSPREFECIAEAAREWQRSTHDLAKIDVYYQTRIPSNFEPLLNQQEILIEKLPPWSMQAQFLDSVTSSFVLGYYDAGKLYSTIYLVTPRFGRSQELCVTVTAHEIGHALGLAHNPSTDALMYRTVDGGSHEITKKDVKAFCKLYGCSADSL